MKWPTTHNMDNTIAEAIESEEMAVVVPLQLAIKLQETANTAGPNAARCEQIDRAQLTAKEALAMVRAFVVARRTNNPDAPVTEKKFRTTVHAIALYRALTGANLDKAVPLCKEMIAAL